MRRRKAVLVAALLTPVATGVGFPTADAGDGPGLRQEAYPSRIPDPNFLGRPNDFPFAWIAGSELVDSAGVPRLDSSAPRLRKQIGTALAEARQAARDGSGPVPCLPLWTGGEFFTRPRPRTLGQLVDGAVFIFLGKVSGSEVGFSSAFHSPVTVLEVSVDEWLKESSDLPARDIVYVLYPAGDLSLGPLDICGTALGMAAAPEVGDKVLMFPDGYWAVGYPVDWPFIAFSSFGYGVHETAAAALLHAPEGIMVPEIRGAGDLESVVRMLRPLVRGRERHALQYFLYKTEINVIQRPGER